MDSWFESMHDPFGGFDSGNTGEKECELFGTFGVIV